jgi:hypothetical protein
MVKQTARYIYRYWRLIQIPKQIQIPETENILIFNTIPGTDWIGYSHGICTQFSMNLVQVLEYFSIRYCWYRVSDTLGTGEYLITKYQILQSRLTSTLRVST